MVNMFNLKQASLLFIQLLKMQNAFEVSATQMETHRNMSVSSGDSVVFICNISENDTKIISWSNGRYYFSYSISSNQTFSNFSSEGVKIDYNMPSKISISRAQHDDSGLYTCTVTDGAGFRNMAWNLTVSNKQDVNFSRYIFFILSPATVLLLCCIRLVFGLYRRYNGSGNQSLDLNESRTFTCVVYDVRPGGKVIPSQFKTTAIWRIIAKPCGSSEKQRVD
ncbi:uncharacterized protein LOC106938206 isoform X3 [Poecilia latipinna]|uniref:uncharacterized protein LOC106938206 isoform X3 n=1 Tax=Poecilia latipinna TaxID=48699 RepID=UPI00072E3169|nr:PREDICTED: uncharacterized protein LOC106938206 isoform X3 [Poecilia latipinna]